MLILSWEPGQLSLTVYRLWAGDLFPSRGKNSSSLGNLHASSLAHSATWLLSTKGTFPWGWRGWGVKSSRQWCSNVKFVDLLIVSNSPHSHGLRVSEYFPVERVNHIDWCLSGIEFMFHNHIDQCCRWVFCTAVLELSSSCHNTTYVNNKVIHNSLEVPFYAHNSRAQPGVLTQNLLV
jgi:hypothetical protein